MYVKCGGGRQGRLPATQPSGADMAVIAPPENSARPAPAEAVNVWGLLAAIAALVVVMMLPTPQALALRRADHARPAAVLRHPVDDRGGRLRDQRGADHRPDGLPARHGAQCREARYGARHERGARPRPGRLRQHGARAGRRRDLPFGRHDGHRARQAHRAVRAVESGGQDQPRGDRRDPGGDRAVVPGARPPRRASPAWCRSSWESSSPSASTSTRASPAC